MVLGFTPAYLRGQVPHRGKPLPRQQGAADNPLLDLGNQLGIDGDVIAKLPRHIHPSLVVFICVAVLLYCTNNTITHFLHLSSPFFKKSEKNQAGRLSCLSPAPELPSAARSPRAAAKFILAILYLQ